MMRLAAALAPLLVLVVVTASPAAADPRIGVSTDGVTWSDELATPLFDPTVRWVPGDQRTATFFVRNQSDSAAELSVDLLGTEVDGLIETGDLSVSARGGGSEWRSTTEPGTHRLVSMIDVDAADRTMIDVTVTFDPSSGNVSQTRSLDLDLRVTLQQAVTGVLPDDEGVGGVLPDDEGVGGLLPGAGGPAAWIPLTGIGLLALGLAVVSTRRQEEDSHV